MAEITMRNIVKQYGDGFPAVNDVSLDIADGEFMILVGPSGCGKSTLLRMIVGLEDITSGDMLIGGNRVNDKAPRDRNLAMVFQNYALYPHLTVFENIAFPLRLSGKHSDDEIRKQVDDAAETLELHRAPGPQAGQPLRRPAPAGRDGPGHRARGRRVPVRRAAVEPRRQAARPDAHRDPAHAAPARHHHRLRHPRPDRGDDPRRPGGGAAQGRAAAGRQPARALRAAGQPVRGRLHRLAADELRARPCHATGSSSCRSRPSRCADGVAQRRSATGTVFIVGIRPEQLRGRRPGRRRQGRAGCDVRRSTIDVTEWLGNEQYAYVPYEAPAEIAAQLAELANELDSEQLRTQICVALDPTSRVRPGDKATLWLDTARIHVFDPQSGENLTRAAVSATTEPVARGLSRARTASFDCGSPTAGLLALPWELPLSEWTVPDVALRDIAGGTQPAPGAVRRGRRRAVGAQGAAATDRAQGVRRAAPPRGPGARRRSARGPGDPARPRTRRSW